MAAADHGDGSSSLEEEIELLEAIYIHELTVEGPRERPTAVSVLLHPSTGDEEDKRFVCLTLVICLPQKYPLDLPSIHIKTPRGLSEAHIDSILSNLRELAESCLGGPMLYELIEYAKESLTDNNMPSCACAICLCHFQDSHEFTKTECYHYFHCGCLARYIEFSLQQEKVDEDKSKNEVECPMCRLPITYNLVELQAVASSEVKEEEIVYKPSEEIRKLQKKMASLLEKQKQKGGVIDIEQERNRFLIDITSVSQAETVPECDPPTGTETDTVKPNPVAGPSINNVPKRLDAAKETESPSEPIRSDRERREKNELPKSSRTSRGPRRPLRNKPAEGKFKHYEERRTEKKRVLENERPRNNEQRDREKVGKQSEDQGNSFTGVGTFKNDEQRRMEKKRPTANERPRSTEDKDGENVNKESEDQGNGFAGKGTLKHDEQRRTEKKHQTANGRPRSTEEKDREKVGKQSEHQGNSFSGKETFKQDEQRSMEKKHPTAKERPRSTEQKDGESVAEKSEEQGSGVIGNINDQRKTEKKGPTANERPRSTRKNDKGKVVNKSEEQRNDLTPCTEAKQGNAQTELGSNKNPSDVDPTGKGTKDVSGRSSTGSPVQNSSGERPRSGKKGRGRSGTGRTSAGNKGEFQDGGRDLNRTITSSGEVVKQTAKTWPTESVKPAQKNGHTQDQGSSLKENPRKDNKEKACKPPPGFENMVGVKGGCEQSANGSRPPPPGFETRSFRPRPPPGLGKPVEGAGPSTNQSVAS